MAARGWEAEALLQELRSLAPKRILEIGTHQGESLRLWRRELDPELLVGIQDTDETTPETCAEIDAILVRGRSQALDTYNAVRCILDGQLLDFLYVDGDHTFRAAMRDWYLYYPLLRIGGIVALDDAVIKGNPTVDIYRLWPGLAESNGMNWKLVFGQGGTGIWIGWKP